MNDMYSKWRDFYAEKVSSWMSLEELRAECGKLQTTDATSPEVLLIHAMHALEECVQRDEALLRQALAALEQARRELRVVWTTTTPEIIDAIAALRERLARPPKPTECMNGCPDRQVCDHCQWPPGPDQRPAAVDEAMAGRFEQ